MCQIQSKHPADHNNKTINLTNLPVVLMKQPKSRKYDENYLSFSKLYVYFLPAPISMESLLVLRDSCTNSFLVLGR